MPARILVIEDNLANLDLMTYLLRAFGHTPLTAQDGAEGVQTIPPGRDRALFTPGNGGAYAETLAV